MTIPASKSNRGGALDVQRTRAVSTRAAIMEAARELFGEAGFHATGTSEITARAEMTRGALYHHFADKEQLFEEVCRVVSAELVGQSNQSVAALSGDLWLKVTEAFRHYLGLVATSREYQRILLIDGPVVLGWTRWRKLQSEFVARGTADALRLLIGAGLMAEQPVDPMAHLIQAALNDAALDIANSRSPAKTNEAASQAFLTLLSGLRRERPHGASR
jgi:AcrR family transcriptional regulator